MNVKYLYQMKERGDKFHLESLSENDKLNDLCILMGGEVPNSFCPLHEIAYFFQAWFLSAIGTIFVNRYGLLRGMNSPFQKDCQQQIRREALALSEEEIWEALAFPKVSIICSLDTDIEPYRYVKHQLWRTQGNPGLKYARKFSEELLKI